MYCLARGSTSWKTTPAPPGEGAPSSSGIHWCHITWEKLTVFLEDSRCTQGTEMAHRLILGHDFNQSESDSHTQTIPAVWQAGGDRQGRPLARTRLQVSEDQGKLFVRRQRGPVRTSEGSGGLRGDGSGLARGGHRGRREGLGLTQVPRAVETQAWPSWFLNPWTQPHQRTGPHVNEVGPHVVSQGRRSWE